MTQVLRPLRSLFSPADFPQLLVGLNEPDDSAVYQLTDQLAIITTVDFFPPVVDDPYLFGAIAAANALSDVYAMGGQPLMAMNLVAFPDGYDLEILGEILRGGAEKVKEAGALISGGHSITDKEPKYGLSVVGQIHPAKIIKKSGAKPGDHLILTKPLGTGIITTALKQGLCDPQSEASAIASMLLLNQSASEIASLHNVHAMTDITGYSLIGHAHEMAHLSEVAFELNIETIPWLAGALSYAQADIFPGGARRNQNHYQQWVTDQAAKEAYFYTALFDPQTSGGLLLSVDPSLTDPILEALHQAGITAACKIGQVIPGAGEIILS